MDDELINYKIGVTFVSISRWSNLPMSQCSSPCNEFKSVRSMLPFYTWLTY